MGWITFDEVKVKATRKWKDKEGKPRQETKTFSQTINPYNRTVYGIPKTRSEILIELNKEKDDWLAKFSKKA